MTLVDRVAHGLTHEVRAERPHTEAVLVEPRADGLRVSRVRDRPIDLEVVAPAGELETVVAPCRDLRCELRERQIRPLAGEERDRTSHPILLHDRVRLAVARLDDRHRDVTVARRYNWQTPARSS